MEIKSGVMVDYGLYVLQQRGFPEELSLSLVIYDIERDYCLVRASEMKLSGEVGLTDARTILRTMLAKRGRAWTAVRRVEKLMNDTACVDRLLPPDELHEPLLITLDGAWCGWKKGKDVSAWDNPYPGVLDQFREARDAALSQVTLQLDQLIERVCWRECEVWAFETRAYRIMLKVLPCRDVLTDPQFAAELTLERMNNMVRHRFAMARMVAVVEDKQSGQQWRSVQANTDAPLVYYDQRDRSFAGIKYRLVRKAIAEAKLFESSAMIA